MKAATESSCYHWIVLPNTGIQICRNFPLPQGLVEHADRVFEAARKQASRFTEHEVVRLVREHIACNRDLEATDWIAADANEFVFYRLTKAGGELQMDLVIDTQNGAGSQAGNRIPLRLEGRGLKARKSPSLAEIYVEHHQNARNEIGSLIMDFGNTGSAFVFSRDGAGPVQARIVRANNPFDPDYKKRGERDANILRSNVVLLRVSQNEHEKPWTVLGDRAEELIRNHPLTTYLYAPKKYVRLWTEEQRAPEPTMKFRGVLGQRVGLHPMLEFVGLTLEQMVQHVLAALTNPKFTSDAPDFYPQVLRLMLTYPLTWREVDRELFRTMMRDIAGRLLFQEESRREQFEVELICSEPVAVAAYVLWETFFYFEAQNLRLAASCLGNPTGAPELRMLVLDMGGGSTDIACVQIDWSVRADDGSVDVRFKMLESMRFNRAGDRISHILATAICHFLDVKYGIKEPLDFLSESREPAFTLNTKRLAVSRISRLAEAAKAALASDGTWRLSSDEERELVEHFAVVLEGEGWRDRVQGKPHLRLEQEVLRGWLARDTQSLSLETNGEPGFQDIFHYLGELRRSLASKGREPHLVVLSGRTTRLPFLKEMAARALRLPHHRLRTLPEILPDALRRNNGQSNLDKLAVVFGAQRFRHGDHIRFASLPEEAIFNRYIGTVRESRTGLRLNQILIRPGDSRPFSIHVQIEPARDVRIGHAFREEGSAQVIANLSNTSHTEGFEVELDVLDDYSVNMAPHPSVRLTEWVPGGNDIIVDNFNDTGRIDREPEGLLRGVVAADAESWIVAEA